MQIYVIIIIYLVTLFIFTALCVYIIKKSMKISAFRLIFKDFPMS